MTGTWKYYKTPFEFREPVGENDGPCIYDADNHQIAMLFWPTHPVEETTDAEQETYRLGRLMAVGNELCALLEECEGHIAGELGEKLSAAIRKAKGEATR